MFIGRFRRAQLTVFTTFADTCTPLKSYSKRLPHYFGGGGGGAAGRGTRRRGARRGAARRARRGAAKPRNPRHFDIIEGGSVYQAVLLPKKGFNGHLRWHSHFFRHLLASRRCLRPFFPPSMKWVGEGLAKKRNGCGTRPSRTSRRSTRRRSSRSRSTSMSASRTPRR